MNETNESVSLELQVFEPAVDGTYPIDSVAHLTQTPRHRIALYCRYGFITPVAPPEREGWWFDEESIRVLRRLERLRSEYGLNLRGIRWMTGLVTELEALREEARFLRNE